MRLWTLHPRYIDRAGLLAVWREGLLAKRVLEQWTVDPYTPKGYRNHPQLDRFKATDSPIEAIQLYLAEILAESGRRNYRFDENKIEVAGEVTIAIPVTEGQVEYERNHLLAKLRKRDSVRAETFEQVTMIDLNPVFVRVPGGVETWERGVKRQTAFHDEGT